MRAHSRLPITASFILASAGEAFAAPYCIPLEEVKAHIEFCAENRLFPDAGQRCVRKLEAEVQATRLRLKTQFASQAAAASSAQNQRVDNARADLSSTGEAVDALLRTALAVRSELVAYVNGMDRPGKPSPQVLAIPAANFVLSETPCYKANRLQLEAQIADVDNKIQDLRRTGAKAGSLESANRSTLGNLGASRGQASAAAATMGIGSAGPVPSGRAPRSSSTITGKIRNEKLPGH